MSKEYGSDMEKVAEKDTDDLFESDNVLEGQMSEAELKYQKLSWQKLTVCLIVTAIALGSLSVPSAFAAVGMVAGVILTVSLGLVAIYTSYVVGQVKLKYPHVKDYADAVGLIWGRFGYEMTSVMFVLFLVLVTGSHTLTGAIAWVRIVGQTSICVMVFSIISALLLFALALPPSFSEFAILGYVDFVSIIIAIGITIVAAGVRAHQAPGGLGAVDWTVGPPEDMSFHSAFLACTNIIFAYSFAVCQFSFMAELHTPKDYVKSIWALGLIEIFIYTVTGALIYAFVGRDVSSPALLSAGPTVSRIAFGVALPVIFISGSINSTCSARYIIDRIFKNSPIRHVNTSKGWVVWTGIIAFQTVIAWVVAEAIPFFGDLLGIISSMFISGFSFYWPALFWFQLIKEGKWNKDAKNICLTTVNGLVLIIGGILLGCGTYSSVQDIVNQYTSGSVKGSYSCA